MKLKINNINISYREIGNGDPVLLVHGWGGKGENLVPLAEKLGRERKVYLIDLPGFGESEIPPQEWGVEEYASTIIKFIEHFELTNNLVYMGHSFGGGLGLYIAANHPKLFSKMVSIAAAYHREEVVSPMVKILRRVLPFYDQLKGKLWVVRKVYYRIFHPRADILRVPELESIFRNLIKHDMRSYLKNITTPTLILWGENDLDTVVADAYYLDEHLVNSELKVYDGYTHGLPISGVDMIAPEILRFIKLSDAK